MDIPEFTSRFSVGYNKGRMVADNLVVGERFHGSMVTADFFFKRGSPECEGFEAGYYHNLPFNIMVNDDDYITDIVRV